MVQNKSSLINWDCLALQILESLALVVKRKKKKKKKGKKKEKKEERPTWLKTWKGGVGIRGESPPSFCNGLGTLYIASFRGRTIDLTIRDMDSEFIYALGKVLGTQDRLTLRLASHHCVVHLNLIKINFNTCILNSHMDTSMHLTYNMVSSSQNNISYLSIK